MKIKLIVLATAVLLFSSIMLYSQLRTPDNLAAVQLEKTENTNRTSFPNMEFNTIDGKTLNLHNMTEPTILVHFWAAWCAPCQAEFPELLEYVNHADGKVALISIAMDDRYEDSEHMLDKVRRASGHSLDAPHLYWVWDKDKKISAHQFNVVRVPETIVVDKNRKMSDKTVGPGKWNN